MKISIKNTCIALSVLVAASMFSSCADLFQGKVPMDTSSTITNLADFLIEEHSIENLDAPAQVLVSQGDDASSITVSWSAVEGAQSYRLERAVSMTKDQYGIFEVPDESEFKIIQGYFGNTAYIFGDTSYTDSILHSPTYKNPEYGYKYFYRVSAENTSKGYGASEFTEPVGGTLFSPPTNTNASAGSFKDKIVISWAKSSSTSTKNYTIYRSTNADGSNSIKVASVKSNSTSYTDPIAEENRGKEFYYFVCAENSLGSSSVDSSIAMGYARANGAPVQITDVKVVNGRGHNKDSISITWTGENDASVTYSVYRSSSKDSALTMLASGLKGQTSYSYTDSNNLMENIYYYYLVQPVKTMEDSTVVKGQMSDSSANSSTPAEGYILSSPTDIFVTKYSGQQVITWKKAMGSPDEQRNYSYIILGSASPNDGFTPISTVDTKDLIEINGQYSMNLETIYPYYRMQTKNGDNCSSETASVAPAPFAAKNVSATRYANLSSEMGNNWKANVNEVYPVKITWEAPGESSDVAGYYVYRSDKKDSGYKRLSVGNDEKTFLIQGTTFYDINDTARSRKIYYYKVLSINNLGGGSNYSEEAFGYGALTADQYMREYNVTVRNSQKKLTLMHKKVDTDKLGKESATGTISGSLDYNARIDGLGARITMHYENYADYFVHGNGKIDSEKVAEGEDIIGNCNGEYFHIVKGDTNTSAEMTANGTMDGNVECVGMYPGSVGYNNIKIKAGAAGGGYYVITREGFAPENVDWKVAEL